MITQKNGIERRNLENTVQWCVSNISNIYETNEILSRLGIRVVDQVATPDLLPARETYSGDYGDAVLVGEQTPYDYYIWTRPFPGEAYGEWFNIGQFPLPGPQGATGETGAEGPEGKRGNKWFIGYGVPSGDFSGQAIDGDFYLERATNDYYQYSNDEWTKIGTLTGPRGVQGPIGPKGDTAAAVQIVGVLSSVDQLPDPASVPRYSGYLVTTNNITYLYGITGTEDNLTWTNFGEFNAGSLVTTSGVPQTTWDTTKAVASIAGTFPGGPRVYGTDDGRPPEDPAVDVTYGLDSFISQATVGNIPCYLSESFGQITPSGVGRILQKDPVHPYQVSNKNYVDNLDSQNVKTIYDDAGFIIAYTRDSNGNNGKMIISTSPNGVQAGRLAHYFTEAQGNTEPNTGRLLQQDPVQPYQVANKQYVDNSVAKMYMHRIQMVIDSVEYNFGFISSSNEQFTTNWAAADKAAVAERVSKACARGQSILRENSSVGSSVIFCTAAGGGPTITCKEGITTSDTLITLNIENATAVNHIVTEI